MTTLITEHVRPRVLAAQEEAIQQFTLHPVTVEIHGGPYASNSSKLLGGIGNLFSFIGFEYDDDPTEPIYNILQRDIKLHTVRRGAAGKFTIKMVLPTKQEIFAETPMPWAAGQSWAEGIEKGIAGFGKYMYNDEIGWKSSRSDSGLEAKGDFRSGKFKNTKYISEIIRDFHKKIGIK